MYNDMLTKVIIKDLENKTYDVVDTIIELSSQGYFVNKNKFNKLNLYSVFIHAFKNINILNNKQKSNIELLYNNLSVI